MLKNHLHISAAKAELKFTWLIYSRAVITDLSSDNTEPQITLNEKHEPAKLHKREWTREYITIKSKCRFRINEDFSKEAL